MLMLMVHYLSVMAQILLQLKRYANFQDRFEINTKINGSIIESHLKTNPIVQAEDLNS